MLRWLLWVWFILAPFGLLAQSYQIFLLQRVNEANQNIILEQIHYFAQKKLVLVGDAMPQLQPGQNDPKLLGLSIFANGEFFEMLAPHITQKPMAVNIILNETPTEKQGEILQKLVKNGAKLGIQVNEDGNFAPGGEILSKWGLTPEFVFYKNGVAGNDIIEKIKSNNFKYALGTHGGVASALTNPHIIPQNYVPADGTWQNMVNVREKYYDMPVKDFSPPNLNQKGPIKKLGFTILPPLDENLNLKCLLNNQTSLNTQIADKNRVIATPPKPIDNGIHRITCTSNYNGVGYWVSRVFMVKQ